MNLVTTFSGWGPCGPLDTAGETEFYAVYTVFQFLALGLSGLILLLANSRLVSKFDDSKQPRPFYLVLQVIAAIIKVLVAFTALGVIADYTLGDAMFGKDYDEGIPCDPVTMDIVLQASLVLALTGLLGYRQHKKYAKHKAAAGSKR